MIVSGVLLSALEQQVIRVVSVNGRAAAAFAEAHPDVPVFGPLTAQRQSILKRVLHGSLDASRDIRAVADLARIPLDGRPAGEIVAYVVDDPQMKYWTFHYHGEGLSESLHSCIAAVGPLDSKDLGLGRPIVSALRSGLSLLPAALGAATLKATDPFWEVAPARVYAVTGACAREGGQRTG